MMTSSVGRDAPSSTARTHRSRPCGRFMVATATVTMTREGSGGTGHLRCEERLGMTPHRPHAFHVEIAVPSDGATWLHCDAPLRAIDRLLEKCVEKKKRQQGWSDVEVAHVLREMRMQRTSYRSQ